MSLERYSDREYQTNLASALEALITMVRSNKCQVVALATDNCPAMVAAARQVSEKCGLVQVKCLAHWANLICKDVGKRAGRVPKL